VRKLELTGVKKYREEASSAMCGQCRSGVFLLRISTRSIEHMTRKRLRGRSLCNFEKGEWELLNLEKLKFSHV